MTTFRVLIKWKQKDERECAKKKNWMMNWYKFKQTCPKIFQRYHAQMYTVRSVEI